MQRTRLDHIVREYSECNLSIVMHDDICLHELSGVQSESCTAGGIRNSNFGKLARKLIVQQTTMVHHKLLTLLHLCMVESGRVFPIRASNRQSFEKLTGKQLSGR